MFGVSTNVENTGKWFSGNVEEHWTSPAPHGVGSTRHAVVPEPPHALEVNSATIGTAVGLFERYALGNVSIAQLAAATGLEGERIQRILRNPLYNGWVRRHRGPNELRLPAPWRSSPPVSDGLWARVAEVRRSKTRSGGPRHRGRADLLAGLLECVCGRRVRSDGTFADGRPRKFHPFPVSNGA